MWSGIKIEEESVSKINKKDKTTKIIILKKEYRNIIVVSFIAVVTLFSLYTWQEKRHVRRLASVISEMTAIKGGLDWNQMGEQEKKSKYRQMMIRILAVHGFQYDSEFKKAMNNDEKIKYINFNFEAATRLNFGLFDVPVIHQMETSFNPYAKGAFNEIGIGQVKYGTALLAERLLKLIPSGLKKLLDFELKSKNDLLDPIISTKVAYVLLWFFRREFKGREDWYISIYHWGSFLAKRWDKGKGDVPIKFTLNDVEYNVIKYYLTFKAFKETYETGQLEVGRRIEEKWRKYQKQMVKEEINFRRTKKIIKDLRKQLVEKKELEKKLDKKHEEISIALNKANEQLKDISKGSQKDGKISLKKIKDVIKDLLKKIK